MTCASAGTCSNMVNKTFAHTARMSRLEANVIVPLKSGDTINLQGYRATGEKDLITVNFQLKNSAPLTADPEIYIYTGNRVGTVVSVSEAHTVASGIASTIALVRRRGGTDDDVVLNIPLNGPANTTSDLPLVGANVGLIAGDSLKLSATVFDNIFRGVVITVVIELD